MYFGDGMKKVLNFKTKKTSKVKQGKQKHRAASLAASHQQVLFRTHAHATLKHRSVKGKFPVGGYCPKSVPHPRRRERSRRELLPHSRPRVNYINNNKSLTVTSPMLRLLKLDHVIMSIALHIC